AAEQHYLNHGAAEALAGAATRKPAPWFDIQFYYRNNSDLVEAGLSANELFDHFVAHGINEGRSPNGAVNLTKENLGAYAAANADLMEAFEIEDAANLTDAQALQLAQQFYAHGYSEDRPAKP